MLFKDQQISLMFASGLNVIQLRRENLKDKPRLALCIFKETPISFYHLLMNESKPDR